MFTTLLWPFKYATAGVEITPDGNVKNIERGTVVYHGQPNINVNWNSMNNDCVKKGRILPTYEQLCPSGKGSAPVGGQYPHSDMWAPIQRQSNGNKWVQIGRRAGGMCNPLSTYHGSNGSWMDSMNAANHKGVWQCFRQVTGTAAFTRRQGGLTVQAGRAFVPEVLYQDKYYPICGHYFWDNDNGATTVCKTLGFNSGTRQYTRIAYDVDSMPVGKCNSGQELTKCTSGGNAWGNLNYNNGWCKKGNPIGVTVTCDNPTGACRSGV